MYSFIYYAAGSELHHDGASLPIFPQLQPAQITSSESLYCSSANPSDQIFWILSLPTGTVTLSDALPSGGGASVIQNVTTEGVTLCLFPTDPATPLPIGNHKCIVNGTDGITILPVLIFDG